MDQQLDKYYSAIQAQYQANNAWSAEQAQKQMDFQERMSNTAHQREVADLKAAGLNPVLSAGGSGAAAMTGAQAERSDANVEAMYGLMAKAFDAQIKQAEAMQASAKAISGSSGTSVSGSSNPLSAAIQQNGASIIADWIYRKFGIKQEHSLPLIQAAINLVGDNQDKVLEKLYDWGFISRDTKETLGDEDHKDDESVPQNQKILYMGTWYDVPPGMTKAQAYAWLFKRQGVQIKAEAHAAKGAKRVSSYGPTPVAR